MQIQADYQPEVAPRVHTSPFAPSQYQVRPSTTRCEPALTTAFPALLPPLLYVARPSLFPTDVARKPLIEWHSTQIVVHPVVIFAVVEHASSQELGQSA